MEDVQVSGVFLDSSSSQLKKETKESVFQNQNTIFQDCDGQKYEHKYLSKKRKRKTLLTHSKEPTEICSRYRPTQIQLISYKGTKAFQWRKDSTSTNAVGRGHPYAKQQ